jgi:hypothetical protein
VLQPQFASVADVKERLGAAGYLTDEAIATTVFLADRLGKPLLSRARPASARPSWPSRLRLRSAPS